MPCRSVKQLLVDFQSPIAFNLVALLFLTHLMMPRSRVYTSPYFKLSHYNPDTGLYAIGRFDFHFVLFFIVFFTGIRHAVMAFVLSPLAKRCGIEKRRDRERFAEQTWNIIHYSFFWPFGIYIWYNSPYYLNMAELWTDWPSREVTGTVKFYFLTQWAFWIQQLLVSLIEKQRKDHWMMLVHHLVTIALVAASYSYHFTRVGNVTMIIMDVVDIVFPLAKCARYLGYSRVCDCLFGLFVAVWLATRHVFFSMVLYSVYFDARSILPRACYRGSMSDLQGPLPQPEGWSWMLEPFSQPQGIVCVSSGILNGFFAYLAVLEGLMLIWGYSILQVALRVLGGHNADDVRSEDEEEEEGEDLPRELEGLNPADYEHFDVLLYEPDSAEGGAVKAWDCGGGLSLVRGGISSGLNLAGQSEHKELLSRIG
ncbi:longevity assurance proteins LAG1/LAC1 [Trichoderma reesei RUT C-30]|uniref:Longevity assurance proteins LAG1/LAC1 n=1 Tax=Hypocrea jecorina (strain ATCC 56765 / BCRC 32924 / NRRL 11460 / Rut C-30) TaxID=1344414 RepID=A0A024S9C6_HYPJR|nr:longevity assurance proteins LAG1/LAC1 [Trichoderma reesei RUT C-30]